MVACKTIGEYRRNQEKIKNFCLEEAEQAKKSSTTVAMKSHPAINVTKEIPGPSRMPEQQATSAPKRTRSDFESSNKPKKRNYKKEITNTKWSKERVIKLATKKNKGSNNTQKEAKNRKNKQSSPVQSFNEKAKQAALRQSLTASTRRLQSATSDTDTNRSFLIFNTPTPPPPSIQIFNVDNGQPIKTPFEIIASNDPTDFMQAQ